MRSRAGGRTRWWAVLLLGSALLGPALADMRELRQAVRSVDGEAPSVVMLPDRIDTERGARLPRYRFEVDAGPGPTRAALYLPGLVGHARIEVNGHVVADTLRDAQAALPRGADRLLLAAVPQEFLRAGRNVVELTLGAPRLASLSPLWFGAEHELAAMRAAKLRVQIIGPLAASVVVIAVSVVVLLLWARRTTDTLFAYFGIGGIVWGLHNLWALWPQPLLASPHQQVWFISGYPFFVAPLVVFCLRLAEWRWPRFERVLWVGLAISPALLYAAEAAGEFETASTWWRLAWIGAVAVGVFGVARFALRRSGVHGWLLLSAGAMAFVFATRDWLVDRAGLDNNPVWLTSYAGLLFFPLVAWLLIDRFVQTSRELQRLNVDLEHRVAHKGAELRHALDAMRDAKDAAEAANRAKSKFLAAASHDLRQPVHALGLYMAALRGQELSGAQLDVVERMDASAAALDTMFDALLDVSRMDAGAIEPRRVPFALPAMLHRVGDEFAGPAADKGLRLSVRVPSAARQLNALSDPLLVERIVRNLLANAVKYTTSGGVLLACRLRGERWRVEVWDSGPGIPQAERERIYEEFYQLGNPERDRAAGLGLGLSIVRRLASLLELPLSLESRLGRGSCFAVELPVTRLAGEVAPPRRPLGSLDGMCVAVIDDDASVRDSMRMLLAQWGCEVVAGADAAEVLRRRGTARLHAAIVDLQLRGSSGLDAVQALRAAAGGAPMPALLVSGASSAGRLAELKASGFEWLTKPAAPARLRSWLVQARLHGQPPDVPLPPRREAHADGVKV
jgi:signal transduction histidine kinase/ActR/RegA family two-component response regulator